MRRKSSCTQHQEGSLVEQQHHLLYMEIILLLACGATHDVIIVQTSEVCIKTFQLQLFGILGDN
jgi:hypothetical protein